MERKSLVPENRDFDPESAVGKIIDLSTIPGQQAQLNENSKQKTTHFFCDTCNCALKDSQAWFDHINGKKHNRMLGMSMVVENVGLDRVKARLAGLKRKRPQSFRQAKVVIDSDSEEKHSNSEDEIPKQK